MAGLYIHIPFCKKACHYCNFHFSTSLKHKNELLAALLNEITIRQKELGDTAAIETIYFGGGTPGLLHIEELDDLLKGIQRSFDCSAVQEITIEMNPDDVTDEKIAAIKKLGFTRVSLGVQSFFDEDLLYMNRSHNAAKANDSIRIIQHYFKNYTVDLIYGYPMLSDDKLASNVKQLLQLNVPHISIYGMTVEPKTALDNFIKKGHEKAMQAEQAARQFEYLMDQLPKAGYEHYEISSYAKEGFRALHNSNYWKGKPYLGFGPGAHTFCDNKRSWNIANNALYIKSLQDGKVPQEQEVLSRIDELNELVMLGLRVKEGLNLDQYKTNCNDEEFEKLLAKAQGFISSGLLLQTVTHLLLTNHGKLFCDKISAELFL